MGKKADVEIRTKGEVEITTETRTKAPDPVITVLTGGLSAMVHDLVFGEERETVIRIKER